MNVFGDAAEAGARQVQEAVRAGLHCKALLRAVDKGGLAGLHVLIQHGVDGGQHPSKDGVSSSTGHLHHEGCLAVAYTWETYEH